ncbi:hypothetical protein [Sulfuricurvum sp.]|uniref:hypothetical protein n=1 Tax=Sulfuricurvum sp. TaxID=2025608 RepID=UPI0035680C38
MPSATPALKRQNHRIHPCNSARKNALLTHLINEYAGKSILIVTANDPTTISVPEDKNITLTSDELLAQMGELTCDILISYDLPDKAIVYMSRFARAREYALILLGAEDQKFLYAIETLLGRTITQEAISGFEPDFGIAVEQKSKEEASARRAEREAKAESGSKDRPRAPKRDDKARGDRPDFKREERGDSRPPRKPFSDSKSGGFEKKDSKPRFVGKDENGKPIFENKTRERNHYIDGKPRTDAEKAARTPYVSKPKFFGDKKDSDKPRTEGEKTPFSGERKPYDSKKPYEKKPYGDKPSFGDKKPYEKKPYEGKKSFDNGEKKPYEGKKPFGDKPAFGDKKPYGEKKPYDAKKPFGDKKSYGDKKPYDAAKKPSSGTSKPTGEPKRPPRRINVKSLTPPKESE